MFGFGGMALIISIEEMDDVMKTVNSLEKSGLLIKGACQIIQTEAKEKKEGFLRMLSGTLGAILLRNRLTGKGTVRVGEGTVRPGQYF